MKGAIIFGREYQPPRTLYGLGFSDLLHGIGR